MPLCAQAAVSSPAHVWFVSHLPEINSRARAYFSDLKPEVREEAVQDCLAVIWKQSLTAARRGVLDTHTPFHAVVFAGRGWRSGRRFGSGFSKTDVMAEGARAAGRVNVACFSDHVLRDDSGGVDTDLSLSEVLPDRRGQDNPAENVRRDLDYPHILKSEGLNAKAKKTFYLLAESNGSAGPNKLGKVLGVSPGRVCQLKGMLADALGRHEYRPCVGSKRRGKKRGRKPGCRTTPVSSGRRVGAA